KRAVSNAAWDNVPGIQEKPSAEGAILCDAGPLALKMHKPNRSRSRRSRAMFEDEINTGVARRNLSRAAPVRLLRASKSVGHRHGDLSGAAWVQGARHHFRRLRFFAWQTRWRRPMRRDARAHPRDCRRNRITGERRLPSRLRRST